MSNIGMKKEVKRIAKDFGDRAYHARHKKQARKVLKSIESVKGKTDKRLIKLSDEYAKDIFGSKAYAPWLYVYSAVNQSFKEGWIPDNYYGRIVVPKLKGDYGKIAKYNSLVNRLFNSSYFPNCAYYTNGLWFSPEYQVVSDNEVVKISFKENTEKVVYKIDHSKQGKGVHIIEKEDFNTEKLAVLGNGVLQEYINQHSFFQDIISDSIATLRVTSVITDEGLVAIKACYLRVGRSSEKIVKSSTEIIIPVDISTGLLDKFAYTADWLQIDRHPDTDFVFESKQIPDFKKFIDATVSLHKMVPFTRVIGWDMILDVNNNVQVMEWNGGHNGIKFSEAIQGPCFSDLAWEKLWKKDTADD